jgi:hypothetical protein
MTSVRSDLKDRTTAPLSQDSYMQYLVRLASLAALSAFPLSISAQAPAVSPVSIHGYLTQAYGITDRHQVAGMTKDGTADYRRAAVVARYAFSPKDNFVVQVGHRRLGDSPTMNFEDNVKVDMAFYERRFGTGSTVRVGKTLMPFGIYNEIRYAGTLLPFYRAPISVYWEGTYTNETIDGVAVSHRFRSGKAWELSADVFGGSYSLLEFWTIPTSPTTAAYVGGRLQAKNAFGGQLWLATPIEGLRVGVNGRRHTDVGGIIPRGKGAATQEWNASVDGTFEKWQFRAEGLRATSFGAKLVSRYAQAGFRPVDFLSLNAQAEFSDVNVASPTGGRHIIKMIRDNAVGINLFLGPMTVLKLEAHAMKGFNYEQVVNLMGTPLSNAYFISSFSVSF